MKIKDNPGVLVPPPMIYAAVFGLATFIQSKFPIKLAFLRSGQSHIFGWLLIVLTAGILLPSLWRFWNSKNTLITIKPATSLQTSGIYAFTRNPMYLGLMILYIGLACFSGNCWTFLLIPLIFMIVQKYVIAREENYLERTFKDEYKNYKMRVRRWI